MEPYSRVLICGWHTDSGDPQEITAIDGSIKTIPKEHERVHAGKAWLYKAEHFLVPSSFSNFVMLVDSGAHVSLRDYGLIADKGPIKLRFYEEPYFDANSLGVELPLVAMNRITVNTPSFQLYGSPFVDANSLGLELDFTYLPNSTGNQPFTGGSGAGAGEAPPVEFLLGNGIQQAYLFRLENIAVDTATIQSRLWAYED